MTKPLVSVIIVNWNGAEIIADCLKSLSKQNYKPIEIIVVDNKSSDNSCDVIRKFKDVTLIASDINTGFAGGNNLGYSKAKGKHILLLNTDTIVPKDFLVKLVEAMEKDSTIGIVQPKFLYENKTINSLGAYLTNTGFLYYPGYGKKDTRTMYSKSDFVFSGYGACMLIRRKVIEQIGLFDDDYFMYFEETDFSMRAWLAGWKAYYTSETEILHKGGVSSKKFGLEKIYFHSFKNRICTYIKNLDGFSLLKILPLHIILCEGISVAYILTGQFSYFVSVQKALWWNIKNLSSSLQKRKLVQSRYRKVKDATYFKQVLRNPRLIYYLYLFRGLQYYRD